MTAKTHQWLSLILVCMAINPMAFAEDYVVQTANSGFTGSYLLPINTNSYYCANQSVYEASELGNHEGYIRQIGYYICTPGTQYATDIEIYMGHKSTAQFSSSSDYMRAEDLTLVYSGSHTVSAVTANQWEVIDLSESFYYNGVDNLVIVVCNRNTTIPSYITYYGTHYINYKVLYRQSSSYSQYSQIDYGSSYYTSSYRPDVQLVFGDSFACFIDYDKYTIPESIGTLPNWTSTNHAHSSKDEKTYTFFAEKNTDLSFNWSVSSENNCDKLYVMLDGNAIVNGVSGSDSSSYVTTIQTTMNHTLYMYYQKDGSASSGNDEATVTNILYTTPAVEMTNRDTIYYPETKEEYLEDWISSNHFNDTRSFVTYDIIAATGDSLSLDWITSSETDCDVLNIKLDGEFLVQGVSGNGNAGSCQTELSAGQHTLFLEYVKDEVKSLYDDEVRVTNIKITYAEPRMDTLVFDNDSITKLCITKHFGVKTFVYRRSYSNDFEPLYVPFELQYEDWQRGFEIFELNDFHQYDDDQDGTMDRNELEVIKLKEGATKANTPYLIRAKIAGKQDICITNQILSITEENSIDCSSFKTKYTFTGSYSEIADTIMSQYNRYALTDGIITSSEQRLPALCWYMTTESRLLASTNQSSARIAIRVLESPSSITEVGTDNADSLIIYNLQGQKLSAPVPGKPYIRNGAKFLIR